MRWADGDGLAYDTDLLTLAEATEQASDPALKAELDGFASLLNHHDSTSTSTSNPSAAPTNLKESQ